MNAKTEYGNYNEDDFIEIDGQLKELTVTITLCEYRNLITERTRQERELESAYIRLKDEIDRNGALQAENEALKARVDELESITEKQRAEINNLSFDLRMKKAETRCTTVERNQ